MKTDTQKQTGWEEDFAKLMKVEEIGNIKLMRSNNFLVAVGFIRTQIMLAKTEERAFMGKLKREWYMAGVRDAKKDGKEGRK